MNEDDVFAKEIAWSIVLVRYRGGKKNKTHRRCVGPGVRGRRTGKEDRCAEFFRTNHPKVASDLFPSLAKEGSFGRYRPTTDARLPPLAPGRAAPKPFDNSLDLRETHGTSKR
jgi:hypothetical protein